MRVKVFKIGLRQQLIVLVLLVTSFSLMILAIITGIYFSTNYKSLRANRLQIVAQMKASQTQQNLNYLYYQVYWLASKDTITKALVSYRAGNTSSSNWNSAEVSIEQFLTSSNTFTNVRLYDTKFNQVVSSAANWSNEYVSDDVLDELFPLDIVNASLPDTLESTGVLTGPVVNDTSKESSYVMSMTLPIYASASILTDATDLAGYMTTIMSAQSLITIMKDSTLNNSVVFLLKSLDTDSTASDNPINYSLVLPPDGWSTSYMDNIYSTDDNYIAEQVLHDGKTGSTTSTKNEKGESVAAGYSPVSFNMTQWAAVVEQPRGNFLAPSNTLTRIIIGVVFGTAVFMGIIAVPLAHWAVQPILRLQQATETITEGRGLQTNNDKKRDHGSTSGFSSLRGSSSNSNHEISPHSGHDSSANENGSVSSGVLGSPHTHHGTYISSARVPEYSRFFNDELSKLTETFNVMTDELDRQYSKLEERVKARTKQLEAAKIQAEAANEAKTVFIANISHELRTPLNGILGMTAIAMAENDESKIQQSLKLIFRSGELLLHILTELLTFSKNSLKRSKLENSDFTALEVALQIKSIFGKLAKDQNVKLDIRLKPDDIRKMVLYGDSNRIIQVVMNLVSNSLKFTPVEGSVNVTIQVLGEYDRVKSEDAQYQQVFVKENYAQRSVKNFTDEKLDIDDPLSSSPSSDSSNSIEDEKLNANDGDNNDDQKSIVTASTSSYDDNVFNKQFKSKFTGENSPSDQLQNKETRSLPNERTWVFEFVVEDTGPGIDPKLQKSVFEPFVQGDQTLSRQYGGTGLGLSICTQLASMMNGIIDLESTVGVGSKFTFRVPLVQQKEFIVPDNDFKFYEDEFNSKSKKNRRVKIIEPEKTLSTINANTSKKYPSSPFEDPPVEISNKSDEASYFDRPVNHTATSTGTIKASSIYSFNSQSTHGFAGNNLKILVAEDNKVNQEVIRRMLNLEGFADIDLAVDGEEVINHVIATMNDSDKLQYDIIFMDVQMPKVDGLQATKRIRDLGFKGPIVALTAFTDESNVKECLDAGMIGFLSKPIRRSQLRHVLTEFCPVILKEAVTTPMSDDARTAAAYVTKTDDNLNNDKEKNQE